MMSGEEEKLISRNKDALYKFSIEEHYEAGIELRGSEVKSLRDGRANLKDSYARFDRGELYLLGLHISPYPMATHFNHPPRRPRKLLMHKRELKRLMGKVNQRGYTLVPTRLYFKRGRAKVEIGLAKGKKLYDRRQEIKRRDQEREMRRLLKR
jgi:SsrA-binding protein